MTFPEAVNELLASPVQEKPGKHPPSKQHPHDQRHSSPHEGDQSLSKKL
jgi:hypothetical protein